METLVTRLEAAVSRLESIEAKLGLGSSSFSSTRAIEESPISSVDPSISEYDELVGKSLGRVLGNAEKIGGQVLEGTLVLKDAFGAQRDILLNFKKCKATRVVSCWHKLYSMLICWSSSKGHVKQFDDNVHMWFNFTLASSRQDNADLLQPSYQAWISIGKSTSICSSVAYGGFLSLSSSIPLFLVHEFSMLIIIMSMLLFSRFIFFDFFSQCHELAANVDKPMWLHSSMYNLLALNFTCDYENALKQPDLEGLTKIIQPLNESITKANTLTEGKRTDFFNHLKGIAESLTALVWVAYSGKDCGLSLPAAHVEESWQAAEFYNNKVLVEYKNKDSNHVEWAKALKELYVPGLRDYIRKFYPKGPIWNPVGAEASISSSPPPPKAATPGAHPPPPPPPPPPPFLSPEIAESPKEGMSAVFQEINMGESVTVGLKKVTNEMKTKNRCDRSGAVTVGTRKNTSGTSGPAFSKAGPPKLELQMGRKWVVENQIGKKNLTIEDCNSRQSVYIFGCRDSVLQVQGKVNNITVDKCTKTGVVFTDVVAACEIVNCNSIEVQCQGTAPTIAVDNTSGCQLYLSRGSLGASITTAKSSEVNVLVPGATDNADLDGTVDLVG
eukprot:Gb_04306 [translate_table: standard]